MHYRVLKHRNMAGSIDSILQVIAGGYAAVRAEVVNLERTVVVTGDDFAHETCNDGGTKTCTDGAHTVAMCPWALRAVPGL